MEPASLAALGLLGTMYLDSRYRVAKDINTIWTLLKVLTRVRKLEREDRMHIYYRFKERAKEEPDRVFLISENQKYTFGQLERASNRLAHWLLSQNVKPKDVVCMMYPNHPAFVVSFFAISKIGAIPSLINTSLADSALLHCIKIAKTNLFLFDPEYASQVATIEADAKALGVALYAYGEGNTDDFPMLTPELLETFSSEDTDEACLRNVKPSDAAMLIYTSGTTGMPKAAVSPHYRVSLTLMSCAAGAKMQRNDITYTVLPMYHSSGLLVSFGSTLVSGGTVVLAKKFSASRFWDDCCHYNITVFHYIGELCRYLLNQKPHPLERKHNVRLAFGNGMRRDVWMQVRKRFNIPDILEFYGSTEGVGGFFNYNRGDLGAGAIGHSGLLIRLLKRDVKLIRIDPITEEPLRGKNGFCQVCDYGEAGEMIQRLDPNAELPFTGYYDNKTATDKKVLRNVFKKGDMYFRSGDLITLDRDGFWNFNDRLGDTFRWHSENVSTTEVAQTASEYPGIAEANVYGALVPNHEGRAGMVAIVLKPNVTLDMAGFYSYLSKRLPRYAIPVFLRLVPTLSMTQTFKQQKVELRNQGMDPEKVKEDIYWAQNNTYVPFEREDYGRITRGNVKL
ncbi:hypothetical protein BDB00DRAFT_965736 [Zychaea mexicana]|uniref:uncharacterized protein n=1 Tax=Zychaea mexicana TaxID=64656 RepID=UPI0022FE444A|nr:uncharacterized protein BDB00DRAFT_965736 [Zychaea mexicana]KAI9482511.1 hypothetical protein BDB00DRAFT_965736 [Zychaea mexicana]